MNVRYDKFAYLKVVMRHGQALTNLEVRVLVYLWNYSDENLENAWPGERRLLEHLGHSSPGSLRRAIASLIEKGYLVRTRDGVSVAGQPRQPAVYALTHPTELPEVSRSAETPDVPTELPEVSRYRATSGVPTELPEVAPTRSLTNQLTNPLHRHSANARESDDALTIEKFNKEKNRQPDALAPLVAEEAGR